MKVINRIIVSTTLLVLLSLVSLLAVVFIIVFLTPDDPGKELLDKSIFLVEEILSKYDSSTKDWNTLNVLLSEHGYRMFILEKDNVIYSTLSESDLKGGILKSLKSLKFEQSILAGKVQDVTFAAIYDKPYSIFAVGGEETNKNDQNDFTRLLLLSCLVVIVVILFFSQFFTRKMIWRILLPLNALSDGASRIENGDFSKPVIYSGKDEFLTVCTAFNQMQESLLKEREKTAAYERARTDLIAGISHDLRTPLTSVKGYIKGLCDGVANTPVKMNQYLSIAYKKACDMDVLLQKLFFYSNLETGNMQFSIETQDLAGFAHLFAESVQEEFENKNITMIVDSTSALHPVSIDTEQMHRVLLNLTENAIKYANAESLVLRIFVWRESGMEHMVFADNGHGVPENHLPHLFEQFWRGDEARSAKNSESSGLGLYIVKYIVETHGGFVTANNNNGLQIKISLPCVKEEIN